jgi:hypothetical protein
MAPTTNPTSGASGTSVVTLTMIPTASPATAPTAIAIPVLKLASFDDRSAEPYATSVRPREPGRR